MDSVVMHLKYNVDICRGCLSTGSFVNSSDISGREEDFVQMLQETFNIKLCKAEAGGRRLCHECVSGLLAAQQFKEMVLRNDRVFNRCLHDLRNDTENEQANMSVESKSIKSVMVADIFEDGCDDGSCQEDEPLSALKEKITSEKQSFGDLASKTDSQDTICEKSNTRRRKAKKNSSATDVPKPDKDWAKITEHRGNGPLLRENSLKLVQYSTACVFQWHNSKYTCFCCKQPFPDMDQLRTHTHSEHTIKHIEKKIILQQNQMVKVEISTLNCKLCSKTLKNLQKLREHLSLDHNFEFRLQEDLLVPFKIQGDGLQCQICSENFTVFRLLNMHMNRHYQKQVCHICGAAFSNLKFLNLHRTRVHRKLSCKLCQMDFATRTDKRNHDVAVHELKSGPKLRFPCPHCDARFRRENLKVLHLVEQHGMKRPEYKCGFCPKTFVTRSLCNNHAKSVHLKERKHACAECGRRFYSACDVTRHRATHAARADHAEHAERAEHAAPAVAKHSLRRPLRRTHHAALHTT